MPLMLSGVNSDVWEWRCTMTSDTVLGLITALVVVSSVAWVSEFRKVRDKVMLRKAIREEEAHQAAAKPVH